LIYQLVGYPAGLLAGGPVRQATLEAGTASPPPLPPGIHQRDGHELVVNLSAREAETDRCTAEELASRFQLRLGDSQAPPSTIAPEHDVRGTELIDSEMWPWLAGLLAVGLVIEGLVANRTAA
jgi:hypothetical protein